MFGGGLTSVGSMGYVVGFGSCIQRGIKENLPVWGKYDRLYGVV